MARSSRGVGVLELCRRRDVYAGGGRDGAAGVGAVGRTFGAGGGMWLIIISVVMMVVVIELEEEEEHRSDSTGDACAGFLSPSKGSRSLPRTRRRTLRCSGSAWGPF